LNRKTAAALRKKAKKNYFLARRRLPREVSVLHLEQERQGFKAPKEF
jgi:hypothetical protein